MKGWVPYCRGAPKLEVCRKNDILLKVDDIFEKVNDICWRIDDISKKLTIYHISETQTSMEAHGGCFRTIEILFQTVLVCLIFACLYTCLCPSCLLLVVCRRLTWLFPLVARGTVRWILLG